MSGSNGYVSPALERWRSRTSGFVSAVAIGSLPILILEVERDGLAAHDQVFIDVVNVIVFVVFLVDYLVGLRLTSDRWFFFKSEWLVLVLVVSQAMVLLPSLAAFGLVRTARLMRLVRLIGAVARIIAIGGVASRQGRHVLRERATSFAFGLAGVTWLSSAAAFTVAEDVGPDGRVGSFFDALWWSLATITTVGYGDIAPVTAAGRIVGGVTMLVGVAVVAILTAKIAEFFWSAAPQPAPSHDDDREPVATH